MHLSSPGEKDNWDKVQKYVWELNLNSSGHFIVSQFYSGLLEKKDLATSAVISLLEGSPFGLRG